MPWILKVTLLLVGSITAGIIPALGIMWVNYNFDPTVCWPNAYGGWVIVPMALACTASGGLALDYLERRLGVCNHGK
jgi:hypothetical protein